MTPTSSALWLGVLLAQTAPVAPTTEAAPPAPARAPAAAQRVHVAIAAGAASDQALERLSAALADALGRLGLEPELERVAAVFPRSAGGALQLPAPAPDAPPALARLFIDLKGRGSVALYVVDDQRERVFVRRFARAGKSDELLDEQLVLAASSSVDAILAGQLIGMPRRDYEATEPPAPAPPPSPPPRPLPARSVGSLSAMYGVSWLGSGAFSHGPSLGVTLERAPWGLGLWAQGRLPVLVGQSAPEAVQVRLTSLGFRYRAWLAPLHGGKNSGLVGLGFGADFTQVSPRENQAATGSALAPYWAADALLQGYLGFAHQAPGFRFALLLGVDAAAAPVRYAVDTAGGLQDVFEPFRVRPFLELELAPAIR